MKKDKGLPYVPNPSAIGFSGPPEDCFEGINCYGTYNIQHTADTDNPYPAIAQGLPRSLGRAEDHPPMPRS